jgi:hypothetical protein
MKSKANTNEVSPHKPTRRIFSSWCERYLEKTRPTTSKARARIRQAIETMTAKDAVVDWIGISGGPWATAQGLSDYQTSHSVKIPLALDASGELFRAFGVRDIPTSVLIDSNGRIVSLISPEQRSLELIIKEALRPITLKYTPSELWYLPRRLAAPVCSLSRPSSHLCAPGSASARSTNRLKRAPRKFV